MVAVPGKVVFVPQDFYPCSCRASEIEIWTCRARLLLRLPMALHGKREETAVNQSAGTHKISNGTWTWSSSVRSCDHSAGNKVSVDRDDRGSENEIEIDWVNKSKTLIEIWI